MFIWLHWALVEASGPSLQQAGSAVVTRRLSSCGTGAWLPHNIQDLSSPTRAGIHILSIARQTFNHWITREVPVLTILD